MKISRQESIELLLSRSWQGDEALAGEVAAALGDIKEAVSLAACFLRETRLPPKEYLRRFLALEGEILGRGGVVSEEYPVLVAAFLSLNHMEEGVGAALLMVLVSFLEKGTIPLFALREWRAQDFVPPHLLANRLAFAASLAELPKELTDRAIFDACLVRLGRYALLAVAEDRATLPHPLIGAAARRLVPRSSHQTFASLLLHRLESLMGTDPHDERTWPRDAELLPHILAVSGYLEGEGVVEEHLGMILSHVGGYLVIREHFARAKGVLLRALPHLLVSPKKIGEFFSDVFHNLGDILKREEEDSVGAEALYEGAVRLAEAVHHKAHPEVARHLRAVGDLKKKRGAAEGARACYERALAIDEAAPTQEPGAVGESLTMLGLLSYDEGELDAAAARLEAALAHLEASPRKHLGTKSLALCVLGVLRADQEDFVKARPCFERAVQLIETEEGSDTPEVSAGIAPIYRDLGRALENLGEHEAASVAYEKALALYATAGLERDLESGLLLQKLGLLLHKRGDKRGARERLSLALEILRESEGEEDPDTVSVRESLQALSEP